MEELSAREKERDLCCVVMNAKEKKVKEMKEKKWKKKRTTKIRKNYEKNTLSDEV